MHDIGGLRVFDIGKLDGAEQRTVGRDRCHVVASVWVELVKPDAPVVIL